MKVFIKAFLVFVAIGAALLIFGVVLTNTRQRHLANYSGAPKETAPELWSYTSDNDEMTTQFVKEARIASPTTISLQSPYQGQQHAILVLRNHPRFGRDVILRISRGQLICAYRACTITVRFDEQPPEEWPAGKSSDGDTTVLFLKDHDRFVHKLKGTRVLRIQPSFYQNGTTVLEFPVEGFSPARYMNGK